MLPVFADCDVMNVLEGNAKLFAYCPVGQARFSKRSNFTNLIFSKSGSMDIYTMNPSTIKNAEGVDSVLSMRKIFEICKAIVCCVPIFMIHLFVGRDWPNKGHKNETVNRQFSPFPIVYQLHPEISATAEQFQNTRRIWPSRVICYSPTITDNIFRITGNLKPRFHAHVIKFNYTAGVSQA